MTTSTSHTRQIVQYGVIVILGLLCGVVLMKGYTIIAVAILGLLLALALFTVGVLRPDALLLGFIFSLPFERIPSLHAGGATVRISQLLLLILVIATIAHKLVNRSFKFRVSPYFYAYSFFILALLASFTNMIATGRGKQIFVFIVFTSLSMWIVPALISSTTILKKVGWVLLVVTMIISVFGLYQFVGDMIGLPTTLTGLRELYTKVVFGIPRIQATELEPLYLANFLIIPISLAVAFFIRGTKGYSLRLLIAVIGIAGLVFVLTLSRGGYLGLVASLFVILCGSFLHLLKPKTIALIAVTLALIGGGLYGFFSFSQLGQRSLIEIEKHFTNVGQDASSQARLGTYGQALDAYDTSPLTGVGIGNFGPFAAYYADQEPPDGWAIVNNGTLELLAETGILGLCAWVLLMALLIIRSYIAMNATKDPFLRTFLLGLVAALVGVLVQYQSFSTFYIMHIWTLFGLLIAVQNLVLYRTEERQDSAK